MQKKIRIFVSLFLVFTCLGLAQKGNDPFIGTFSGSGLTLTLTGHNAQYTGSALFVGETLQVSAQKSSVELITGFYISQGESLPFQARLQGNTLTLAAGGEVYSLTKQAEKSSLPNAKTGQSGKIRNDEWGMSFDVPADWSSQLTESGYVFGSKSIKGILLLLPNEATSLEEIRTGAREGITEAGGTQLRLSGKVKPFTKNGLAANYTGTLQGEKAKAYAIGLLSPHSVGAIVLVAVEPQSYSPAHTQAAESLARSIRFYKSPVSPIALEWKQKLSGCRLSYFSRYSSGSSGYTSETTIDLCSQGFFRYNLNDETVWNASPGTLTGGYSMQYGKGSGTWKVITQNSAPILQLNYYYGKVAAYQLSTDAKDRTFLDGDRYLRTCNPNDQVVEARPNCW